MLNRLRHSRLQEDQGSSTSASWDHGKSATYFDELCNQLFIDKEQGHEIASESGVGNDYRRGACDPDLGRPFFLHYWQRGRATWGALPDREFGNVPNRDGR